MKQVLGQIGVIDTERIALRQRLLEESRPQLAAGLSLDALIQMLHDRGLSIVESAWVLGQAGGLSLREAKERTTGHPVWEQVVKMNEPLHDELEKMALDWEKESGNGRQ